MQLRPILFSFLLLFFIPSTLLSQYPGDTVQAENDILRSDSWLGRNIDSARFYADRALAACSGVECRTLRRALSLQGLIHAEQADYNGAIPYFDSAARMAWRLKDTFKALAMYDNSGIQLQQAGRIAEAVRTHLMALKLSEGFADKGIRSDILNNLGVDFQQVHDGENSIKYLKQSLALANELQDAERILKTELNLGSGYAQIHQFVQANQYLWKVVKACTNNQQDPMIHATLFDAYQNLAASYLELKQADSAIYTARLALGLLNPSIEVGSKAGLYHVLAPAYILKGQSKEARQMIDTIQSIPGLDQSPEMLVSYYSILYGYHRLLGQHDKAYEAIDKANYLRDSLVHMAGSLGSQKEVIRYEVGQKALADSLRLSSSLLQAELKAKTNQTWLLIAIGGILLTLAGGIIYFQRSKNLQKQNRIIAQEKQLAEYNLSVQQLKTLQAQMNPHFIFNCFNTIDSYILQNKKMEATQLVHAFSKLTRRVLEHTARNEISLEEEMETLEAYLTTELLRHPDTFSWTIQLPPELKNYQLPPLLLQPFVENAVIHGIRPLKDRKGQIDIEAIAEKNRVILRVKDNGVGRQKKDSIPEQGKQFHQSMSMQITRERIAAMYGEFKNSDFILIKDGSALEPGTLVEIIVPLLRESIKGSPAR